MLSALLGIIGFDLKREVRSISITVVLALAGAFLLLLALGVALRALHIWLELRYGVFPAYGMLGAGAALMALVLFAFAFWRPKAKPARRAANPLRASAAALAEATEHAMEDARRQIRGGNRKQVYGTILIAVLAGLLLGRRM